MIEKLYSLIRTLQISLILSPLKKLRIKNVRLVQLEGVIFENNIKALN